MSLAPPPPPPPAAPIPSFASKSDSKDGRGLLLESIRKGTTLKKTVTVDKSAPLIGGNVLGKSQNNNANTPTKSPTNNKQNDSAAPQATLGGLFANGIPKLKATGLPIGQAYQQYRNENDAVKSNSSPVSNNNSNSNNSNKINNSNRTNVTRTRGPPPRPPGLPPKNHSPDAETNDGLPVHSRSGSVVSLNDSYQNRSSDGHIVNHGKPTLAPKPQSIVNKSIGNRNTKNDARPVTRAQSMRVPRSALNVAESNNGPQYHEYNQSELYRINNKNNLPSFHQSQESIGRRNNRSTSPPRTPSTAMSWSSSLNTANATLRRPHGSPLRPPLTRPPPPPSRMMTGPPNCPPPPPPSHAPPPPPHRVVRAPPPPRLTNNNFMNSGAPPVPPVRNSSMRSSNPGPKISSFESRFMSMFHSVDEFPPPQPYQNVIKIYNSRIQAKQQAPQPPLQLQKAINRGWQLENTSNC